MNTRDHTTLHLRTLRTQTMGYGYGV